MNNNYFLLMLLRGITLLISLIALCLGVFSYRWQNRISGIMGMVGALVTSVLIGLSIAVLFMLSFERASVLKRSLLPFLVFLISIGTGFLFIFAGNACGHFGYGSGEFPTLLGGATMPLSPVSNMGFGGYGGYGCYGTFLSGGIQIAGILSFLVALFSVFDILLQLYLQKRIVNLASVPVYSNNVAFEHPVVEKQNMAVPSIDTRSQYFPPPYEPQDIQPAVTSTFHTSAVHTVV